MSTFDYMQFTEGAYTDVSIHLVPTGQIGSGSGGALWAMSNVVTSYKLGSMLKRPGYSQIGSTIEATESVGGMHNFRQSASTQKMLLTIDDSTSDDTQLFYGTGSGWTEIAAAETAWANKAGIKVEFADMAGYCYMVGWGSTDGFISPASLTGTTFSTSTNVTSMPNAKYIIRYRDRIFIGNTDISGTATPFRVYYSSVPSAGTITWDTAEGFFDVDYSEAITGLGENWDRLMVFTEYSAWMVTGVSPLVRKKQWDVGCSNHRTIKNSGQYMIWANRDGVWVSQGGSDPVNIAGRVIDFVRFTNMTNSFAEIVDEEYYLWIGSVTVNGISYSNCAVVLNIPTMTWRIEEYADTFTIFSKFYSSGQDYLWMGTNDGEVMKRGKYTDGTLLTTDDGSKIDSFFQTGAIDFGSPSSRKIWNKIYAYADRAQGMFLKARVVDVNNQAVTPWRQLGELTQYVNEFQVLTDQGSFLQLEGVESGSNQYWSFYGFTVDAEVDSVPTK